MAQSKRSMIILMAEDDNDYFEVAKEAFEQYQIINELRHVEDGEELMDYLLHRGKYKNPEDAPMPGMIFLDLNMPRKNGLEALKEIKTYPELSHIPIVMLTISRDDKDILRSYQLGANSFMTKPISFSGLVDALKIVKQYWFEIVALPSAKS